MKVKIAVAGGVTGGHLYPALSVLEFLSEKVDTEVLYFTVKGKLEEKVLSESKYRTYSLNVQGLIRPIYSFKNIPRVLKIFNNKKRVLKKLKEFNPDIVFVTGGYVSYPVGLSAYKLNIPLYIHEQNVIPGLSNLKLSKFAEKIFVSFESSIDYFPEDVKEKIIVSGNPVRIKTKGELKFETPTILIVGGSGGSEFLNELACKLANKMKNYNFILSSGGKKVKCKEKNLKVFPYIDNMYDYYRSISCAITRGGATTIYELLYFEVPSIVIPWEGSTESHQIENAKQIVKSKLGYMIKEKEVNLNDLVSKIEILVQRERKILNKKNPAKIIVEEILKEVKK
ncbi:UDP-N-acetylglucosamine--N-acetylmuramyl-(pentapeptide) pyrophosphoryl-undecaprenol N-acetylglucosamine transferase [Thermosipho atlanticus]|uniref:UDP-N-acetylglucosamine--N-acetylmuramyl-(pentapeptide) pyrophosphoryl-undecaprenol N-acetylglucosamine transferase n=1 Tax=Thermosipho atlanticus DSM 15807 TaxID=1123380 RepID=A0A1M5T504_9BACT|nr:UDP-N-acetylglucosamine-N-acetylmuramylpentapeptide N-acetylglucosamine transferase [Thermosipho atlanticus DSM 15807]